ncbi:hypothetical protein PV05_06283 [Exophiala xenobiotica]|uniref:F-box domain-containing protein n=1 Tax=Exophiala xenobiotica TaxID=348802 RepID=A0A0D2CUU3_9EURO|nr:uncharacterized protein PV05_06283 [Exophiala xenobiotica]KIW53872.1 hypothetical protein PV05_06283 [Exophiala xenobiotica]
MDDDNPPPRKRSRFFSNGRSKIGSIIQPLKRPSRRQLSTGQANASSSNTSVTDDAPILDNPAFTRSAQPSLPISNFDAASSSPVPQPEELQKASKSRQYTHSQVDTTGPPKSRLAYGHIEQEHAQADHDYVATDQDRNTKDDASLEASTVEQHPPHKTTVKSERRKAIYGIDSLQPQNGQADPEGENNQNNSEEPASTTTANPDPFGPIATQYTFTGVPSSAQMPYMSRQALLGHPHLQPVTGPSTTPTQPSRPVHSRSRVQRRPSTPPQPIEMPTPMAPNAMVGKSGYGENGQTPPPPDLPPPPAPQPYIDMDRDDRGHRIHHPIYHPSVGPLPSHVLYANTSGRPAYRVPDLQPISPTRRDSLVPDTHLTSPKRIERAKHQARINLKRKRADSVLPPPAYVYQRTNNPHFNIFHGLLLYPELVFALASALPVKDLVSLYAISKDFHTIIDTRFTTVILSQALSKAPESARSFGFRSYASLCRNDPAARIPHPNAAQAALNIPRRIPSFRWLKMILHREKVIHELVTVFAEDGIPLPFRCRLALKRLWFMLDLPDNARRIGYVHNHRLLTNLDLYFAACFFTKLDMRLNDPVAGEKRDGLRRLLMQQRSFTTILRVLKRDIWTTKLDVLREWVRQRYEPRADEIGLSIFGVPADRAGKGRLEYWGERNAHQIGRVPKELLRPDQLVVREAIRRGMPLAEHYVRFMLYGYVRPDTLKDYAPRKYGRRIEQIKDDEYELDDVIGGVAALGVEDDGFDELLDLGPPRQGSVLTIVKEETSRKEKELRQGQKEFAKKCVEWWKREMEMENVEGDNV